MRRSQHLRGRANTATIKPLTKRVGMRPHRRLLIRKTADIKPRRSKRPPIKNRRMLPPNPPLLLAAIDGINKGSWKISFFVVGYNM